jgi:hypothetical protein
MEELFNINFKRFIVPVPDYRFFKSCGGAKDIKPHEFYNPDGS